MTSQEVVERTPQQELMARVRHPEFESQLALVLPEHVSPQKFGRIFGTWLLDNPEAIEGTEPNSIMQSLLRCAEMGLMPDGREAAIVAFFDKRKQAKIAQTLPMVGGIRKTAADYGWDLQTRVVYANDEFSYEEMREPPIHHVPVRPGADKGSLIAAYAWAKHRDGRRIYLPPLDEEYIDKVRAVSRMGDKGAWVDWTPSMWAKTAGHRLFDVLPIAESDRIKLMRAALSYPDSVAALYGPQARAALEPGEAVDRETGEILPVVPPPTDAGGSAPAAPEPQQAEGATPDGAQASSSPAPSVPEDDPEPTTAPVVPDGTYAGKTIVEIATSGANGEKWLSWAMRHPESPNVGAEFHAALTAWFESQTKAA